MKRGQVVVELVDTPFRIALAQAEARLADARRQVRGLRNDTGGSAADVAAKREALDFALTEMERQQTLLDRGFATRARLQQALAASARSGQPGIRKLATSNRAMPAA